MIWQDFVIGVGQFTFVIALLPAIFGKQKPPVSTCCMTGIALSLFAIAYLSLDLWLAAAACIICALCWLYLVAQQSNRAAER